MTDNNGQNLDEQYKDAGEVFVAENGNNGAADRYFSTIGSYASGTMKTEENSVYYTQQKLEKTAAVVAAFSTDMAATTAANNFNAANLRNRVGENADEFYQKLGYGDVAQNKFQEKFSEASFRMDGDLCTGADVINCGLTEEQMAEICTKGFTATESAVIRLENNSSTIDLAAAYTQMKSEQERVAFIENASSTADKATAVLQLQNRAVGYFRGQGEGWETFCDTKATGHEMLPGETRSEYIARECQKRTDELNTLMSSVEREQTQAIKEAQGVTGLEDFCSMANLNPGEHYAQHIMRSSAEKLSELENAIKSCTDEKKKAMLERQRGSVKAVYDKALKKANIETQIKQLGQLKNGPLHDGTDGKGSQRKYGRRVVARSLIGDDMMRGSGFIRRTALIASTSYRIASEGMTHIAAQKVDNAKWKTKTQDLLSSDNGLKHKYGEIRRRKAEKLKINDKQNMELQEARKRGKKEFRQKKHEIALENRQKRIDKRIKKEIALDEKYESLKHRIDPLTKSERRQLNSLEARNKRRINAQKRRKKWDKAKEGWKKTAVGSWTDRVRDKWKDRFAKGNAFADKIWKKLLNPISAAVTVVKKAITKSIKVVILIPVGIILIFCFLIAGAGDILILPVYFLSAIPDVSTHLQAEMDNANYVQIIVNDTSERLSKTFVDVARKDAQVCYINLEDDPAYASTFASPNYDWLLGVNEGHVKDIYEAETYHLGEGHRRVLNSPNDNLLQITSMMHARYIGEIGYENWNTARGYVYYMYVASHDRGDYSYEVENPHTRFELYTDSVIDLTPYVTVSGGIPTIERPEETCENVYLHGYSSAKQGALHDLQKTKGHLLSSTVGWLNKHLGVDFSVNTKENGLWIHSKDGYPKDSKGECDNAQAVASDALKPEDLTAYLSDPNNHCPGLHTHSPAVCMDEECAKLDEVTGLYIATKIEHDHSGGRTNTCNAENCKHEHNAACGAKFVNVWNCGHFIDIMVNDHNCGGPHHYPAYSAWVYCNHVHTADCCSLENHHHTPTECMECGDDTGKATRPEHTEHTPWRYANKTDSYTGCYDTIWVCGGHCGGHITPQIDLIQNQTWEGLAQLDSFQTVRELTDTDLAEDFLDATSGCKTLENWKAAWENKMTNWWRPLVLSGGPVMWNSFWTAAKYNSAGAVDWFTGFISSFGNETEALEETNNAVDIYGFEGWFVEDDAGRVVINQDAIDLLGDLYGTIDDNFQTGYELWEAFEVKFPRGAGIPLTSEQIEQYMYYIKGHHPTLGEKRFAVLEEAMNGVGMFWYDLSGAGHENGRTNTYGRSECSGFVSGVLTRAFGREFNCSAAGFASLGVTAGNFTPGDVIAHANGGKGYTGHVMIYVGYIEDGPDGDGEYVIDCSSTTGGSTMRKTNLASYRSHYFPN